MAMSVRSATSESADNRAMRRASERDALVDELRATMEALAALISHGEHLGTAVVSGIQSTLASVEERMGRKRLVLAVVGEPGAGKTTFINALIGTQLFVHFESAGGSIRICRGPHYDYAVRFRDGINQTFAENFPDQSDELVEQRDAAEHALVEAAERRERLKTELREGTEAVAQARAGLSGAFTMFESAREEAARVHAELATAEREQTRLEEEVSERERALPVVIVRKPPFWAFWLWLFRTALTILHRDAWRAWRALRAEQERARANALSLRAQMDAAAAECASAEAQLSPSASPAELAHTALSEKHEEWAHLEARISALTQESQRARAELERVRNERPRRFFEDIAELCDVTSRGKDVLELEVTCPARLLQDDISLLCVPGILSEDKAIQEHSWKAIADTADGCILVAEVDRGIDGATRELLHELRNRVPYISLVLTKMDQSFTQAVRRRSGEPKEAIDQATRIGTRRFAREIGREPTEIFSVAVAAKSSLKDGEPTGLSRRFAQDVRALMGSLRRDRELMLGVRAAQLLQECIREAGLAQHQAERSYQEKLITLLEQRTPEPNRFRKEQLDATQPVVREHATKITRSASGVMRAGMHVIRNHCADRINATKTRAELRALGPELEQIIADGVERVEVRIGRHVEERSDRVVRDVEILVFDALRQRYGIAPDIMRWSNPSIHLDEPAPFPLDLDLAAAVHRAVRSFEVTRLGLALAGGVAGALVGSIVLFGVGTVLGFALGTALLFVRRFSTPKSASVAALEENLKRASRLVAERTETTHDAVASAITEAVDASVARATIRYGKWIAAPLEAERAALVRERDRLHELQALRDRLRQHDARLTEAYAAAADASAGLCKTVVEPIA